MAVKTPRPPMSEAAKENLRQKYRERQAAKAAAEPEDEFTSRMAPNTQGETITLDDPNRPSRIQRLRQQMHANMHVREVQEAEEGEDLVLRSGNTTMRFKSEGGERLASVEHIHPGLTRLYKGNRPTYVPTTNWDICIENGMTLDCSDCGTDCGGAEWGCGKQPEPRYMQCPVCGRKFYDDGKSPLLDDNPNRIAHPSEAKLQETGALAKYTSHLVGKHPDRATAMGILEAGR